MRTILTATAAVLGVAMAYPTFAKTEAMTPQQYLEQAKSAILQHHRYSAVIAVNNAENVLVESEAAQERHSPRDVSNTEPSVVKELGRAREAIQQSHWNQAMSEVDAALSHPRTAAAVNP